MCAALLGVLVGTIVIGVVLSVWIGWFTLQPLGDLDRIRRVPNWFVFGLVGVMLLAVLALAVLGC